MAHSQVFLFLFFAFARSNLFTLSQFTTQSNSSNYCCRGDHSSLKEIAFLLITFVKFKQSHSVEYNVEFISLQDFEVRMPGLKSGLCCLLATNSASFCFCSLICKMGTIVMPMLQYSVLWNELNIGRVQCLVLCQHSINIKFFII